MIELSPEQARRIAVRAQALDGTASGVLDTVRRIGYLQLDPTNRVARSHLLVLWSRLGPYDVTELDRLLWEEHALFEWNAFIYPMEDLPLLRARARMRPFAEGRGAWRERARNWMEANRSFREYVLSELRARGPLPSREIEDKSVEPWQSTGWTANRNVQRMLEFLSARFEVAVAGRRGAQRLWDVAERWYPDTPDIPADVAERELAVRGLRRLGIVPRGTGAGPGVAVRVAGTDGTWVADPELLETADESIADGTTLLSPFDRLIYDRERAEALFGFRYRMEIYIPKADRQYGYFVLPVLRGDRLVGRIDPEYDRRARLLRVNSAHPEPGTDASDLDGLDAALASLAEFVGADRVERLEEPLRET